jgi:phage terminase small subunit
MAKRLSPMQQRFIAELQRGLPGTEAAIAAGYSPKTAKHAAYDLQHRNALVMAELRKVRAHLSALTEYNGERAADDCDKGMQFALRTDNANAFMKAVELKARLNGLLRDKLDVTVERLDINDALAAARARAAVRPLCDLPPPIDGEFEALPSSQRVRSIDNESTSPLVGHNQ